jgi:hypothetical protein
VGASVRASTACLEAHGAGQGDRLYGMGSTARGARLRDRVEHHAPLGLVMQHNVHIGATQHDGEGHAAAGQKPACAVGMDAQDEPDVTLTHVLAQGLGVR